MWEDGRWWAIGAAFVAVVALGVIGFREYDGSAGLLDPLYRSLQLFVLESGAIADPSAISPALQVARFAAPVVAVVFVHQAAASLLRDQLQLLRLRRARGHVVVCGLGAQGLAVARATHEQGRRVAAVERDESGSGVRLAREAGIPVVVGDATDPVTLRKARVGRASVVVAACREDATNAQIASACREVVTRRREPLECFVHVFDPRLCAAWRARAIEDPRRSSVRIEYFSAYEAAAQAMLLRHPFLTDDATVAEAHVLVVGLGRLGERVVVEAARTWEAAGASGRFPVSVVDREADERLESLRARFPELDACCDLVALQADVGSGVFERGDLLRRDGDAPFSAAYVCLDDEQLALHSALVLDRHVGDPTCPVVVRLRSEASAGALLGERPGAGPHDRIHAFGLVERSADPDLLFLGTTERIARALHDVYVAGMEANGWAYGPVRDDERRISPSLAPWGELDEELRRANRDQAAGVGEKLDAVGCGLSDVRGPASDLLVFGPDEVELLAEMEHERWERDLRRRGWTLGAWDREARTSPYLIPWSELDEDARDRDRRFVEGLPGLLAGLGLWVVRLEPGQALRHA